MRLRSGEQLAIAPSAAEGAKAADQAVQAGVRTDGLSSGEDEMAVSGGQEIEPPVKH